MTLWSEFFQFLTNIHERNNFQFEKFTKSNIIDRKVKVVKIFFVNSVVLSYQSYRHVGPELCAQ